jgi:uncharacterized RDD family membrane protein YckC
MHPARSARTIALQPLAGWAVLTGGKAHGRTPAGLLIGIISRNAIIWFLFLLASIGWWIYNRCIQAGRTGQSLGKKTLHLRLLSEKTGEPIGGGMAFARDICHILDSLACYIGWLFPLWDAKRQTFADKIISTVVIPE